MGACFNSYPSDPAGYVGIPLPNVQFKLLSVPDSKYKVTDEHPRGEVLLKSPSCTAGYFNDRKLTEELFHNGWLKTGDVAELRCDLGMEADTRFCSFG